MNKKINVFYVWGYASSPETSDVKNLQKYLGNDFNVTSDYYAQYDPNEAIIDINNYIKEKNIDLLVGSSLGGFLTLQIPNIAKVIINPCLYPDIELPKLTVDAIKKDEQGNEVLDEHGNKIIEKVPAVPEHIVKNYTDYVNEQGVWNNYNSIEDTETTWIVGDNDELLEGRYIDEIKSNVNNYITSKQGHKNTKESIENYVVPAIKKMFNK